MLTLFACPKPFTDPHIRLIQRNAIASWKRLPVKSEILLFGNEEGASEICREFGLIHFPEIAKNSAGTPLVNDIFQKAQSHARFDLLCYVNADIILMADFYQALQRVAGIYRPFLLCGRRWDVLIEQPLSFARGWEASLKAEAFRNGQMAIPRSIDYFVFRRNFFPKIPPFALGRGWWDNWFLEQARRDSAAWLIDATPAVTAIHQRHGYAHLSQWGSFMDSPESKINHLLAGRPVFPFTTEDATHQLTPNGIRFSCRGWLRLNYFIIRGTMWWANTLWYPFLIWTRPFRRWIVSRLRPSEKSSP